MIKYNSIITILAIFILLVSTSLTGCSNDEKQNSDKTNKAENEKKSLNQTENSNKTGFKKITAKLPENINWITNNKDPVFSSSDAVKGGTFRSAILSFPMTFRTVGPDSNGSFRSAILDNHLSLINLHPNTGNIIPELATDWAFDNDKKTMYFKLNKKAKWSDGVKLTAWDFSYALEFMRSEHIIAPWYNDYYTKELDKVIVYDDYTLAIKSTKAQPDLYLRVGIAPIPRHFFGKLDENFVHEYNWKIVPNTGAYEIYDFKKGKWNKFVCYNTCSWVVRRYRKYCFAGTTSITYRTNSYRSCRFYVLC